MAIIMSTLGTRISRPPHWLQRYFWLPFVIGILISLASIWVGNTPSIAAPIVAVDIDQQRANTMLAPPEESMIIQQSFYPRWNGLSEIEIILARVGEPNPAESERLVIRLLSDKNIVIAEQALETRLLTHNQTYTLRFPPQRASAGRRYLLQISGDRGNPVSIWGYDLNVYDKGEAEVVNGAQSPESHASAAGELRFVTRYQLSWTDAMFALGSTLYWEGAVMLLHLVVIPLPGVLMLLVAKGKRQWDGAAWWGTALGLGLAGWSLLWQISTLVGGRWRGWSLWSLVALGWLLALVLWLRARRRKRRESSGRSDMPAHSTPLSAANVSGRLTGWESVQRRFNMALLRALLPTWKWQSVLLLLLLLVALSVRLLAVRDLVFPPWVDSSRHALITAVMAESGQMPDDYAPLLPIERAPYHYGFHALSATLLLMSGWPLHRLLLFQGQWLNGLLPLTVYAAVWLFTRRRGTGLLAAFLVALPFFFPAYYTTWGRMTQLAAMFILPVLLALTWQLVRGSRQWRRMWWLVGTLAAALFLVHFRVFLFFIPFAGIVWLVSLGRNGRWLSAAAGLALLLTGPRIVQLLRITDPLTALDQTIPNYNAFPVSYVEAGWERQFIVLAALGFLLALGAALQRRRWSALPLTLVSWVAILFLLLSGEPLGLPETSLVNLNSMYITLFLPLAIFLSVTFRQAWVWTRRRHWLLSSLGETVAAGMLTAALLFGIRQQINILNPQTILARWEDLVGLEWAAENLSQSATVAVNSWRWLGNTWTGSDGGAWLVPLTGRASTTPPVDYTYDPELFASVIAFNEAATTVPDWTTVEAADWLRQQGVTHIFVGARGGFLDPASLSHNRAMEALYGRNGVFIFALKP